jgi:NADH:ubiquinone reductase (H+-translocating)
MKADRRKRILILGGGFGGLYAALELEKALVGNSTLQVTLVNRENFFLFTPMLHEIAASDLDFTHIVNPLRRLLHEVEFFHGEVQSIDLQSRQVRLVHGSERHLHEIDYDYLVIALGSTTNYYGIPGLADRAVAMKSLGDAIHLRNQLIDVLEEADFECAIGSRSKLLTVVVAGGGFSGIETVAAVNDFLRGALRSYPHLTENLIRVVLVHPGDVVLPELGPELGLYAQGKLARRGVEIRVKTKVERISDRGVELDDGTTIESKTVVWTAGTSPSPVLNGLPCFKEHGKLVVNAFLEVSGFEGVWALGDCAFALDPKTGKPYPPTAQHAMRQGKLVAQNIVAAISGRKKKEFDYSTIGLLAAIGRRAGVANILGVNFSGFAAWFLWRTIYLGKLPRLEKKVRVAFDWTLDLLFAKDLVHFMILRSAATSTQEETEPKAASMSK